MILGGGLLLLWPTLLNWHPYLFWDTYGYFLQGKAYTTLLVAWAGLGPIPTEAAEGWIGAAGRMLAHDASIRSPSWSAVTYVLAARGGFWLMAALNALVAAATVELALVRLFAVPLARRLLLVALLAAATSLPWFASLLMPDLYAGLMILAGATLAFGRPSRGERLALTGLCLAAVTFHPSHLLLAVGLAVLAALLPGRAGERRRRLAWLGLPVPAAAAVMLAAAWIGFGEVSLTPRGPPFLLARSWEDGPARDYLSGSCPQAGWALCPELGRLAPSAQEFLWREQDSYWSMDPGLRAAVKAEEGAILRAAIAADPFGQIRASLANAATQLGRFGLEDFVLGRGAEVTSDDYTFLYLPRAPAAVWGLGGFTALIQATAALSLLTVLALLWRRRRGWAGVPPALFVLGALLLNAAICGALSGPHPRYQSRVVWLLPLLAGGLLLGAPAALSRPARALPPAAP